MILKKASEIIVQKSENGKNKTRKGTKKTNRMELISRKRQIGLELRNEKQKQKKMELENRSIHGVHRSSVADRMCQ